MTATHDQPLTPLDKQRFNAWFEHDSRLPELADELNTTVLELAEWAAQPHIARRLDAVATIARQRNATLRAEAQHAATARLLRIVRFCDHDEIARRAADRLLRALPTGERPLDGPDHDLGTPNKKPPTTPPTDVPTPPQPRVPTIPAPRPPAAKTSTPAAPPRPEPSPAQAPTPAKRLPTLNPLEPSSPDLGAINLSELQTTPSRPPRCATTAASRSCFPRARPPPPRLTPYPLTPSPTHPPTPSPPPPRTAGAAPNSTPTLVAPCPVPTITALFGAFHVRDYR